MNHPILFLSHGGGPLPLLGDPGHKDLIRIFEELRPHLGKPASILVISAHWEEGVPTITSGKNPQLLYDYYGFPKKAYEIKYPAPGSPQLAGVVTSLLESGGFHPKQDHQRGWDHGLFVPLNILFPQADIPCAQLSLLSGLDAAAHIRLGKAIRDIRRNGTLVVGSGFSFHNLRVFFSEKTEDLKIKNIAFEEWLEDTCSNAKLTELEREKKLIQWQKAPHARFCHPREEHLMPLHVCYGMAEKPSVQSISLEVMGIRSSIYIWD